jgi:DNA-binding NarL/FixJ family response regulator
VADLLREGGGANAPATAPTVNAGLAQLGQSAFDAVLLELPAADNDGLSQITLLTVQSPRVPIIVFGPANDERFAAEAVRAGAQDYLPKENLKRAGCGAPSAARLNASMSAPR